MSDHNASHGHGAAAHDAHAGAHHGGDAHGDHHGDRHDGHGAHQVNYLIIFGALCVFTILSVLADGATKVGLPKTVVNVIVLAIATAKALSVMLYFMHLKFERNWKYVLLAPTTILALGIPLALLPDIGLHYYVEDVPQNRAVVHGHAADAPAGGAHSEGSGHSDDKGAPGH